MALTKLVSKYSITMTNTELPHEEKAQLGAPEYEKTYLKILRTKSTCIIEWGLGSSLS